MYRKSCIKANEFDYRPVCTNVGIYCMLDQNILWPRLTANVMLINLKLVFVAVNFFFTPSNFFCLFLGMVMYANKVERKEKIKNYLR